MCKPVRYVYPHCGHPIIQDKDIWSLERCPFAQCCNRDCWIPNDIPRYLIEEAPWPYDDPTETCRLFHEQDDSTDSATLAASSTIGEQSSCYETCVEFMLSNPSTPEPEVFDEEELDRLIIEFVFQEGLPDETTGTIPGADVHLDEGDSIPSDDLFLLNVDERENLETHLAQAAAPFSDDQLACFNDMAAQIDDELSFATVEDDIEWEQVRAVQAPLEQSGFEQDMDTEWRFDEWF
ncbi:hypothetical protein FLAG1_01027 [Fusarium langsethiae]|uniref:Uncharacterized protein n=1 Tax=Fusarium langsethiae TaxID=179993 RepID=A0A0M9F516_FUSLA|nr:hypothetical protein FLAG1_01027 [Fusarium langsethiae]GKT99556.1 unnamed protein product [Fusarium langsethiae]GKU16985.1 unnamed protein product [Fusarium langsethiae]